MIRTRINRLVEKHGEALIVTAAATLLFVTLAIIYWYSYSSIKKSISRNAESELRESSLKVNNVVSVMELALRNNVWAVPKSANSIKQVEEMVVHVVEDNLHVMGCGVAYRPELNNGQQMGVFAYDVVPDSTAVVLLSYMKYDYTKREWYAKVVQDEQPHWADPYVGLTSHRLSTSFSMPVYDDQNRFIAVSFVDVALDWLYKVVHQEDVAPNTANLLLSHSGELLVCPDKSMLNTRNFVQAVTGQTSNAEAKDVEQRMLNGERGYVSLKDNDGEKLHVFFAPVDKRVGWSMAVVAKDKVVYRDLFRTSFKMLCLALLGLALLAFIVWNVRKQAKRLQQIDAEKERIGSELRIASEIQQSMIPKVFPPYPDRDDIDVYGLLEPAKYVGGDLFDFYIRDEKLFFCIGDVSGKAVAASLVMAVTQSLFRTLSAHEANAARIMDLMNESMSNSNESMMFVTLFLGVLDLPTGRLRYCNAGHNAPLIIENGSTAAAPNAPTQNVHALPVVSNVPLGIMANHKFEGQETVIKPHSVIFLYTDGLTEAEDANLKQFGKQRMQILAEAYQQNEGVQELVNKMTSAVKEFVGGAEQSDDLTMLAVDYKKVQRKVMLKRSLTLPNDVQTIPQLAEFVEGVGEELGFDMEDTMGLNLALEEAVVNVMTYAYPKGTLGTVQIDAEANDQRLKLVITDQGSPFDPTAKEDADITLSVEDRPIGGLGIFLVRQLMDSINYERVNGSNVLTLRKKLTGK